MTRLAAVTGGTGFLGRALVAALARRGWRIRMLARRNPAQPGLPDLEPEIVFGDLENAEALRRLVRGADAVVHVAGLVKARSDAEFMAANRDGSARLAAALAAEAPGARLVHVSSIAAREPQLSGYAASKRAGEDALIESCGGAPWVVVRPPAIYGPRDREILPVFRAARGPVLPLFQGPEARVCLIHVEDAAEAVAALCAGGPSGRALEISDERRDGYAWGTVLDEAARAVGGAPRVVRVPAPVVHLCGAVSGTAARLVGRAAMLTPGKAREMLHPDWSSAADRQPPPDFWSPRITLRDGFADAVRWYRDARWL